MIESKIDKFLKWAPLFLLLVLVYQSFVGGIGIGAISADNTTRYSSLDLTEGLTVDDVTVIDVGRGITTPSSSVTGAAVFGSTVLITGVLTANSTSSFASTTYSGSIAFTSSTSGIILETANAGGTCVRFGYSATGAFATTSIACP